jgi:hypothetical protein
MSTEKIRSWRLFITEGKLRSVRVSNREDSENSKLKLSWSLNRIRCVDGITNRCRCLSSRVKDQRGDVVGMGRYFWPMSRAQCLQKAVQTTNFSTEKQVFKSLNVRDHNFEKPFNSQDPLMLRPICGTAFSDPLSKGAERWYSSSLHSSSHHLSGSRAMIGLEMGSPRWCQRIWRELR